MKRYLLGMLAIIVAIGFSAFTKPTAHITKVGKFTRADYWYVYVGDQIDISQREVNTNYTTPTLTEPTCGTGANECAVKVTVTLVGVNPPASPDFTNVTFDATSDMPNGGSDFKKNDVKN